MRSHIMEKQKNDKTENLILPTLGTTMVFIHRILRIA